MAATFRNSFINDNTALFSSYLSFSFLKEGIDFINDLEKELQIHKINQEILEGLGFEVKRINFDLLRKFGGVTLYFI